MKPIEFPQVNRRWAEQQPEYRTLPAYTDDERTISCYRLSLWERVKIFVTGRLWLSQLNFGKPLQPQLPQVDTPFSS